MQFQLETGRTHQIRVHMASIGHPLLGDTLYSSGRSPFKHLQGQTLHAKTIGFVHPKSGEYMEFSAPLPEYFDNLLKLLKLYPKCCIICIYFKRLLKEFMTSEVMGMGNYIYTIGRELGSGGYTVAKLLAERLGIKLYDKELLAQAKKRFWFLRRNFRKSWWTSNQQFSVFLSNGYIYRRKLFCSTVFGYAA